MLTRIARELLRTLANKLHSPVFIVPGEPEFVVGERGEEFADRSWRSAAMPKVAA